MGSDRQNTETARRDNINESRVDLYQQLKCQFTNHIAVLLLPWCSLL